MKTKDIKDYLHLYWGCAIADSSDGNFIVCESIDADFLKYLLESPRLKDFKLILRPLSDMTEEEFKEFAEPESFASHGGYWYACYEAIDPDFEGDVLEHINNCCDDDPELVIMCHIRSKHISYGWIEYEEKYHGLDLKEEAEWIRFLLSKGFDLFGLIEAGLAIDKTTLKQAA